MKRYVCLVVHCVLLGCSVVSAQTIEKVDSLLAVHRFAEALAVINAAPAPAMEEARAVINHLQALPNLSDSLFNARVVNALVLAEDYDAGNAGELSTFMYTRMRTLHASQKYSSAYEYFVLAKYFRTKHVREELARLRNNLSLTGREVKAGRFKDAETLLGIFKNERRTSAFQILEDSLHRAYRWLRPQIEEGIARQEVEASWTPIARSVYFTGGVGLNPDVSLDKTQLPLREFENNEYQVWNLPENAITTVPVLFCFQGGYFLSSRTSIGLSLARWKNTFRITFRNMTATNYASYRAALEYTRADAFVKHRFTDKTGPRPFVTAGLGVALSALSPQEDSGTEHVLHVKGSDDTAFRLLLGGGAEYVFSDDCPLLVSWSALLFLNSSNSDILTRVNLETTLQIGVVL